MNVPTDPHGESPWPATDALLLEFGDDLIVAEARHGSRRKRQRRRAVCLGGAATALAAAGTVAVVMLGSTAPQQIDVVAEARAALAPKPGILHIRAVVTDESRSGGESIRHVPGSFRQRWEQWRATDPGRWRVKIYASKRQVRRGDVVLPAVEPSETAFAGGAESHYRPLDGKLHTVTGFSQRHGERPMGVFSGERGGSLERLRVMFQRGELADRGPTSVDGRPARRLVGRSHDRFGATITVDYAVDPSSFAPIRVTTSVRTQPGRHGLGRGMVFRQRIDFEVFETLRATPANERLLRIAPAPGTESTTQSLQELQAVNRARRLAERKVVRKR